MLIHHHLVVRANITEAPVDTELIKEWLHSLISDINMNVLYGPEAIYCTKEGNRGMTAFSIIDTSHIALHTWDEQEPFMLQLDVYSCAEFDKEIIFKKLEVFKPTHLDYKFLDRSNDFIETR